MRERGRQKIGREKGGRKRKMGEIEREGNRETRRERELEEGK
jgi:hypothetical protein